MELIINLLQFFVTLLGFCLSGIRYSEAFGHCHIFCCICFYWLFRTGLPVLDIVSVIVFRNTTDLLCIGIRLGLQRYFSLSPTIYSLLPGGKKLFLSEIPAGSADRSSVVRILLYLW